MPPDLDPEPAVPAPCNQEPGLEIARRALLWLPFAVVGERCLAQPSAAQEAGSSAPLASPESAFAALSHAEFGARWQRLAEELLPLLPEHDESYAAQLAGLVARLPLAALPPLTKPNSRNGLAAGLTWFLRPCAMIEFRLEPGATLRLHNHPPQVVLTLCVEGELAFRHFELEGEAPPCSEVGADFLVRETRAGLLRPRSTTSLTRARDGLHGFQAGKQGARLVDFTLSLTADTSTFSYVELVPKPLDAERRVHEARWLGKD